MTALRRWLGVELDEVSWKEKAISALGGGLSILAILLVTRHALGVEGAAMLVSSMGASAVLLFAVPHGQLSQPWPVIAGHLCSALIGVTCAKLIDQRELAAACAVGLAIGIMHHLKAIHPPGGATALTAVMGGSAVTDLGYSFVLRPVLLNLVVIMSIALVFNGAFPWRRYPAVLAHRPQPRVPAPTHEDVVEALRRIDSFVDVSEEDLVRLHQLLTSAQLGRQAARRAARPAKRADVAAQG